MQRIAWIHILFRLAMGSLILCVWTAQVQAQIIEPPPDIIPPAVTLSTVAPNPTNASFNTLAIFSEPVTGLLASQVRAIGANIASVKTVPRFVIAAGSFHSVMITTAGTLLAWGDTSLGKINAPAGNDYVAVTAGAAHSLALKADGSIVAWGDNSIGQCNVPAGTGFMAIDAGTFHNLALKADGSLVAWGDNVHGECNVPAGKDFVAVSAGDGFSLALHVDGTLEAWGNDTFAIPDVPLGNNFVAIAAGYTHALALRADGTVAAWGDNAFFAATPPVGNTFTAISAGLNFSIALQSDGNFTAWGTDTVNQLKTPNNKTNTVITSGRSHSIAARPDGILSAWGDITFLQGEIPPDPLNPLLGINSTPPGPSMYNCLVEPSAQGNVTVQLLVGATTDLAGNPSLPSNIITRVYDSIGPLPAVSAVTATNAPFSALITFNEPALGFTLGGVSVTNGAATLAGNQGDTTYTLNITPAADGLVGIKVNAGAASDAAGNLCTTSSLLSVTYDSKVPTVALAGPPQSRLNAPFSVTAVFSEPVLNFDVADLAVVNGACAIQSSQGGTTFTLGITPAAEGGVAVRVKAGGANDAAGNLNSISNPIVRTYDATHPAVLLTSAAPANVNAPFNVTVVFSEPVGAFLNNHVTVTPGTAAILGNQANTTYTVRISPSADGPVTVKVNGDVCSDLAGNGNLASAVVSRSYDKTAPKVTLNSPLPNPTTTKPIPVTITFSEDVTGFTVADLLASDGAVLGAFSGSGKVYTVQITPPNRQGPVTLRVQAGAAADAAGNTCAASATLSRTWQSPSAVRGWSVYE